MSSQDMNAYKLYWPGSNLSGRSMNGICFVDKLFDISTYPELCHCMFLFARDGAVSTAKFILDLSVVSRSKQYKGRRLDCSIDKAALAHLGERQTEVHFMSSIQLHSGGTVFDPQKRHSFLFLPIVPPSIWPHSFSLQREPRPIDIHVCQFLVDRVSSIITANEHMVVAFPSRLQTPSSPQFQTGRPGVFPLTAKSKQTTTFCDDFPTNTILHPSHNTVDALTIAVLSPHT
jgi:hypothetical protein